MKFNKKIAIVFLSAVFFIVSLLVLLFVLNEINVKNTNAEAVLSKWQIEYNKREEISSLQKFVKDIAPEKAMLETHFAQSSDIVPFLNTIEALATKAGAKPDVSSVDVAPDNSGLIVGMKASGSFQSMYNFLMLLENSPYELDVVSVVMNKQTTPVTGNNTLGWDTTFKIKLLSFLQ